MEHELSRNPWEALASRRASWTAGAGEDGDAAPSGEGLALAIRPSWSVMVAQLAGRSPEPIRVSDFGRGSRVISRALSGDHGEHDLDEDEDGLEERPHRPMH